MLDVAAIVLCGGESRRMGRPKADLPFGDEALLQRVVRLLATSVREVVVVAAPGQVLPRLNAEIRVARDPEPHRGPLHGFNTGLEAVTAPVDLIYLTPVDAPFFSPSYLELLATRMEGPEMAAPVVDGFVQPMPALYRRRAVASVVPRLLAIENTRLMDLTRRLIRSDVDEVALRSLDANLRFLDNVNDPEQYRRALVTLEAGDAPNSGSN